MAGILTIHSNGNGELLSGHSWLEYQKDGDAASKTYGTWGNNPTGKGNGLFENLEQGMQSDATRSIQISDEQEAELIKKIAEYKKLGPDAWRYLNPCSGFAADAWATATGEKLDHRSGVVSNPSKLKESIVKANKPKATQPSAKVTRANAQSSIKPVKVPVQKCPFLSS